MQTHDYLKEIPAVLVSKDMGQPWGLGEHFLGWVQLSYRNNYAGVYQTRTASVQGYQFFVKEKFYRPTNPNSAGQIAQRALFAEAMAAWTALTTEEKAVYNELAEGKNLHGVNIFITDFLSS